MFISLCTALFCFYGGVLVAAQGFTAQGWGSDPCEKIGPSCNKACTAYAFCTTPGVIPGATTDCDAKSKCVEDGSSASCEAGAFCLTDPALTIACVKAGEIPNPFDCSQYFVCPDDKTEFNLSDALSCPGYWDIATKGCVNSSASCGREPIKCKPINGQVDPKNTRFLYYCFAPSEQIFVYEKNTRRNAMENCKPPQSARLPTCRQENEMFLIPGKFQCYWRCNANLIPEQNSCGPGYYFDANVVNGCVREKH